MAGIKEISAVQVGDQIPPVTKKITQEKINCYAESSGDFNPIHVDEEYARQTPFKGTIAHGLLSYAYASEMMWQWAGKSWLTGGELELAFLNPVRPGDTLVTRGAVKEKHPDQGLVEVEVVAENQEGKTVFKGNASVVFLD